MSVALVVISDGRWDYLEQALTSIEQRCSSYRFTSMTLINDSGARLPLPMDGRWDVITHETRRGLAGAVQSAWKRVAFADHVFHMEEDFVLHETPDLDAMVAVLRANDRLAQLVLKRQPWSPEEIRAGGIIESNPLDYVDQTTDEHDWVEHERIFSLNPCVYPTWVTKFGWPNGNEAEMTEMLVHLGYSFGFWGARSDPPRCEHIGVRRSAAWAL